MVWLAWPLCLSLPMPFSFSHWTKLSRISVIVAGISDWLSTSGSLVSSLQERGEMWGGLLVYLCCLQIECFQDRWRKRRPFVSHVYSDLICCHLGLRFLPFLCPPMDYGPPIITYQLAIYRWAILFLWNLFLYIWLIYLSHCSMSFQLPRYAF